MRAKSLAAGLVLAWSLMLIPGAASAQRNAEIGRTWVDSIGNLHVLVRARNTSEQTLRTLEVECSVEARDGSLVGLGRRFVEGPVPPGETRPAEVIVELGGAEYSAIECVASGRL